MLLLLFFYKWIYIYLFTTKCWVVISICWNIWCLNWIKRNKNTLFTALFSIFFLSWMPRRVLWLSWPRPALRLANQTLPHLPNWPPSPPVAWETRSLPSAHPRMESSTSPWRTNQVSSLTPSHQETVARMFWWQKGLQTKQLSGCQMEAPMVAMVLCVHLSLPIPSHQLPALLLCTLRAKLKDKAIPPPHNPCHTPRLHT